MDMSLGEPFDQRSVIKTDRLQYESHKVHQKTIFFVY